MIRGWASAFGKGGQPIALACMPPRPPACGMVALHSSLETPSCSSKPQLHLFPRPPCRPQVFFYPLRPDGVSWVPVRVGTVTETYVELDANHALAGAHGHELVARVTVVDHKRAGAA